jgi:hypothetical protein
MKRLFSTSLVIILLATVYFAQKPDNTRKEDTQTWNSMVNALDKEDWSEAFRFSTSLLEQIKTEDKDKRLARLRYIHLYAAAGKVLDRKMSYDDLETLVKPFVGKEIVFPYRPVTEDCSRGSLNFICSKSDNKKSLLVPGTNKNGTTILVFEYYKFKDDPKLSRYVGKSIAFSGKVTSIVPNPNRSNLIILRIYVDDATVFEVFDK